MLSDFDRKVLKGISRFEPVSASYLARVINAPTRPTSLKKERKFNVKYELTNQMILNLKQENENDIEKSMKVLVDKGLIVQSVPGYPKRYSVKPERKVKETEVTENFDDDRLDMEEDEYDTEDPELAKTLKEGFVDLKQKINYPKPAVV